MLFVHQGPCKTLYGYCQCCCYDFDIMSINIKKTVKMFYLPLNFTLVCMSVSGVGKVYIVSFHVFIILFFIANYNNCMPF